MEKHLGLALGIRSDGSLGPLAGAQVSVYLYLTGTLASLYDDDEVTPVANPITSSSLGRYEFSAANGQYTVVIVKDGVTVTQTKILLSDGASQILPVADITNPSTELAAISTNLNRGDIVRCVQIVAGSDLWNDYAFDPENSDAQAIPFIITRTAGGKFIAIGPRYIHGSGTFDGGAAYGGGAAFTGDVTSTTKFEAPQLKSTVATGTPPLIVASTTKVANLNADLVDGRNPGDPDGIATLDSGGKVPTAQLPTAIVGALKYKGTWNANTNSPTLGNSGAGGVQGDYYVVSVLGTTSVDGISDWFVGDFIVHNGTAWEQIDNTDAVLSVMGLTGVVSVNDLTLETSIADGDLVPLYDVSAGAHRAMTKANFVAGLTSLTFGTTRQFNAPRSAGTVRGLKTVSISGVDRVMFFEGSGSLRLLEMIKTTDHMLPRFTATGKVPSSWCWTGTLIVCANGTSNLFSVDPAGPWSNPTSGAGSRADFLLYGPTDDCVWGFDNGGFSIKRIHKSTLAVVNTYSTGLGNGICSSSEYPWAVATVSGVDYLYHLDLFGTLRKFNCATQAVTSLSGVVASFGSGAQSIIKGSDGYLYIVSNTGTNKQLITCLNPATDTVVDTIDLSAYLSATASGFVCIAEIQGYLYASYGTTDATNIGTILVVKMSNREIVGAHNTFGQAGVVAGYPTAGVNRAYMSGNPTSATTVSSFDR